MAIWGTPFEHGSKSYEIVYVQSVPLSFEAWIDGEQIGAFSLRSFLHPWHGEVERCTDGENVRAVADAFARARRERRFSLEARVNQILLARFNAAQIAAKRPPTIAPPEYVADLARAETRPPPFGMNIAEIRVFNLAWLSIIGDIRFDSGAEVVACLNAFAPLRPEERQDLLRQGSVPFPKAPRERAAYEILLDALLSTKETAI